MQPHLITLNTFFNGCRCVPDGATCFDVRGTRDLRVYVSYNPKLITRPDGTTRWPLSTDVEVMVVVNSPSSAVNDSKVGGLQGEASQGHIILPGKKQSVTLEPEASCVETPVLSSFNLDNLVCQKETAE